MSNDALNKQIRELTAALGRASPIDASRDLMQDLQAEIARLTEHHDAPVTERLEAMAVRFEADHPAVGTALREAINALSKAGI